MVRVKHQLPTIKIINTKPRIQYSSNYCIDIVPKAKSQYRTSLHVTVLGFALCNDLTVTGTIILELHSNVYDYLYYNRELRM